MIVTTAQLEICRFDPLKIDLNDGMLKNGEFKQVPMVRFRKGLTTKYDFKEPVKNLQEALQYRERTVLIVNSESLCDILSDLETQRLDKYGYWPWSKYRGYQL